MQKAVEKLIKQSIRMNSEITCPLKYLSPNIHHFLECIMITVQYCIIKFCNFFIPSILAFLFLSFVVTRVGKKHKKQLIIQNINFFIFIVDSMSSSSLDNIHSISNTYETGYVIFHFFPPSQCFLMEKSHSLTHQPFRIPLVIQVMF